MEQDFSAKPVGVRGFVRSLFVGASNFVLYGFGAVILTYWGIALGHTPPASAFLLVIAIAFFVAAYWTWNRERVERNAFGALLTPRLTIDFDRNGLGFVEITRDTNTGVQMLFIHALPRCIGAPVTTCRGFITKISVRREAETEWTPVFVHQIELFWAGHEDGPVSVTLYEDTSQFLDVAYTYENNNCIFLVHPNARLLNTTPARIGPMDIFRVDILVRGDGGAHASMSLELQPSNVWAAPNIRRL